MISEEGAKDLSEDGFRVVREGAPFRGKQGHIYRPAISAEAVGSKALHMQLLEIPPGGGAVYLGARASEPTSGESSRLLA